MRGYWWRLIAALAIVFVFLVSARPASAQYSICGGECRGDCLTPSQVIDPYGVCTNPLHNCCVPAPTNTPIVGNACTGTCRNPCLTPSQIEDTTKVCPVVGQKCCVSSTPTATPTISSQTCTGLNSCNVNVSGHCTCDTSSGPGHGSQTTTECTLPNGSTTTCNTTCADDTSCYSVPPPGCPANRAGCTWYPRNECQGGSCGVGESRIAALYCGSTHCDDMCSTDASCGNNPVATNTPRNQATSTPTSAINPPTNTPINTPLPTSTPIATGTIRARAVRVTTADTSCAAIMAVPTTDGEIDQTTIQFNPSSASLPTPQTQSGANYVQFPGVVTGSYSIDSTPQSASWSYARSCWTDETAGTSGESQSHTLVQNHVLRWDIGYTLGSAWVQAEGGDVYASGSLRSFLPAVTPRTFVNDGSGGYPGVIQYGTTCDFDSDPQYNGCTLINPPANPLLVSSTNWNINSGRQKIDFYDFFYRRFGAPTTATTAAPFDNLTSVSKPASNCTATGCSPYYVVGNMTTSAGQWTVGANERIVIIVDGDLTINGNIRITPGGFLAFIVHGDIAVSSAIGRTTTDDTPNVEGIYVASNSNYDSNFYTGSSSTTDGTIVRFVGKGMFVADNFILQRDLQSFGVTNTGAAAELFIYNPQLLLTMPDQMKDVATVWQEVAP